MKNKNEQLNPASMNLPLEIDVRTKLKIFAVLSSHKDLDDELVKNKIKDKLILSLTVAYSVEGAIAAVIAGIKLGQHPSGISQKPEDYRIARMIIARDYDSFLVSPATGIEKAVEELPIISNEKEKSKEQIISYVRYLFAKATDEEKKVAEDVIKKFEQRV